MLCCVNVCESGNGRIQVWPGLGREKRKEWYRPTGVTMGTQLLKAGRVSGREPSVTGEKGMPSGGGNRNYTNSVKSRFRSLPQ